MCTLLCLFEFVFILGICFTIVDVGGQQVENSLWVAGTIRLA